MASATVGRQFQKDLATEKARISSGPRGRAPTALEIAARKSQAEHDRETEPASPLPQRNEGIPLEPVRIDTVAPITSTEDAPWVQFDPRRAPGSEGGKQGPKQVNTISIFCLAKKIMAQEWRRARGIKEPDARSAELGKAAEEYQARRIAREEEKRRQAARLERERETILECRSHFIEAMIDPTRRGNAMTLEGVGDLMAEAFADLGEVFDVEWIDGGCAIWLRPWPDKRERGNGRRTRPGPRRLCLDPDLNVTAYEQVTEEAIWRKNMRDFARRPLHLTAEDKQRRRTPEEVREFLEAKVWEVGRILAVTSDDGLLMFRIQRWEDVRNRNVNSSYRGPIPEFQITVSKDLDNISCGLSEDEPCP